MLICFAFPSRILLQLNRLFIYRKNNIMITFIIIQLPPGDFFDTLQAQVAETGGGMDAASMDVLREQYGLDQPPEKNNHGIHPTRKTRTLGDLHFTQGSNDASKN